MIWRVIGHGIPLDRVPVKRDLLAWHQGAKCRAVGSVSWEARSHHSLSKRKMTAQLTEIWFEILSLPTVSLRVSQDPRRRDQLG